MLFSEIIGQNNLKDRLLHTVENSRISHAQLFLGPEGCGKLALSLAYAQYICCTDASKIQKRDSCGVCPSCRKYMKLVHPDLHFVFPVTKAKKTNPVSDNYIAEWRKFVLNDAYVKLNNWVDIIGTENSPSAIYSNESYEIVKKLSLKTYEAEYKIMIIWMAEKMNISAANKLLKIIEEPPPKTLFLLIAENTEQIISTILSRSQVIKVPQIDNNSLSEYVKKKFNLNSQEAISVVNQANGNYIKVLDVINYSSENSFNFNQFAQLMRFSYSKKVIEIIKWAEDISKLGREKQKRFLKYALRLVRENFILNIASEIKDKIVFLSKEELDFCQKFAQFITVDNAYKITEELNKAHYHIERYANNKIVFLDLGLIMVKQLQIAKKKK